VQIYLPIAELPISVLMVLGLSGAVGFISGLFGVGGGFLLTPLLIFLDIPPAVAVATVAAQVAGSSMTGVLTYLPTALLAGVIGFIGAVLGVGGGFILVPGLIYFFRIPPAVVVGTSLFQILVTMTGATVLHAVTNQSVDIVLAVLLLVGGVIGAQFGGRAARNLNVESFRLLLALLILSVGLRFAIELFIPPSEPFSVVVPESGR